MKPWSVKDAIKERVQKESLYEWSKTEVEPVPEYRKTEVRRNVVGWLNFFKGVFIHNARQFLP